ncbi:MAG TPA: glycoside hydrolase family 127 protein [Candidatus Eisenbergiella merdipullorum]|uniref:Glycoside hydrolase family 127 protein n=1 Tax=Candidatus Eisenbergiella merdipullorum TaxID=2838553 RepID=A0A9D2I787_9FIRM|nr:glycoside hydrolase family 127 protein [Candidatus Eisenbergiella merdipullorum]
MDQKEYSSPLSLRKVQVTDEFWKNEMELVRKEVIPYQWEALNDRIPDADPSFSMRNFKVAGRLNAKRRAEGDAYRPVKWPLEFQPLPKDMDHLEERFYGYLFQDSDFSKWIEAVGYSLIQHPDPELEATADEAIDIVCAAQLENGYLDTYYIISDQDKIFTNLKDDHELYCFGHLTEGAVAYYQATGKDKLLKAAERFADYIASRFGPEEGKKKGYPGHEIAEMALVRLYEQTGDKKYLDLSRFFIDQRGTRPYYFDLEHPENVKKGHENELRYVYNQAHLPVRQQGEAVGHAVRAVYLYSGMADVARLTGDESLYAACEKLWNNMTQQKMYITGGIGATHIGEAFSFNYDLPNDTAYAETCASIGLVFFARRMLQIRADGRYADVMERALYNGVLSGMALNGKSFFYVNPLESVPEACHKDERKSHVKPVRQKWFGCACCPPNLARLVSSIASYAYTSSQDTLYVHLYMGSALECELGGKKADIRISSGFPWNGGVTVEMRLEEAAEFTLAFRIPGWCEGYTVDGKPGCEAGEVKDGYLYLHRTWQDGDSLKLDFPMTVRLVEADSRVREDIGRAAVTRGPIVYCLEEADNGRDLHLCVLPEDVKTAEEKGDILGVPVVKVTADGLRQKPEPGPDDPKQELYHMYRKPGYNAAKLIFIPYFTWANRGEGEMQVFVRVRDCLFRKPNV